MTTSAVSVIRIRRHQEKPMTHARRPATALPIGGLLALLLAALLSGSVALAAQSNPAARDVPADAATASGSADAAGAAPGEAEADTAVADTAAAGDAVPENDAPPPASAGKPTPDVFVPTEEISEDYAVSFPVDI
jgi:hypothetical protein